MKKAIMLAIASYIWKRFMTHKPRSSAVRQNNKPSNWNS